MLSLSVNESVCPILDMLDIDGEFTDNPDEAISVVVLLPNNDRMIVECQRRHIVKVEVN